MAVRAFAGIGTQMYLLHRNFPLLSLLFACLALPANAADRMKAGQWDGSWTGGGTTRATTSCLSQSDADAMNGDAKSIRTYLEKVVPPTICKIGEVKANGSEVTYTSVCTVGKPNTIKTTYHGTSFESVDTTGSTSAAKWVGACKP